MKELSIEQKAKAYDETLKVANKYKDTHIMFPSIKDEMFPELAESEDEKIRKGLIGYFLAGKCEKISSYHGISTTDILAWLEKQGNNMGISDATKKKLEDSLNEALEKETPESFNKFLDEQGEQKPDNELKFEIGDLITNGILVGKIDEIRQLGYHAYFGDHYADIPDAENWHKWTIQDAKDGDVLFTSSTASHETFIFKNIDEKGNAKCYFAYDSEDGFREGKYHFIGRATDCKPATKEQRDLLFQKMHEAGYEWDDMKKELKKVEQKHAWSEEDEKQARQIERIVYDDGCTQKLQKQIANWFKCLKDRYAWKPNEEQMKALHDLYLPGNISYAGQGQVLIELYNDLKKLKE